MWRCTPQGMPFKTARKAATGTSQREIPLVARPLRDGPMASMGRRGTLARPTV